MPDHFGKRLKRVRQKRGFTMDQLGKLIGVAKTTISGYENGNREPQLSVILKLAYSLHTSADYMLGLTEIMEQPLLPSASEVVLGENSIHWDGIVLEENEIQSIRELMESIINKRLEQKKAKEAEL